MTDVVITQLIAPAGVDLLRRAGLAVLEAGTPDPEALAPHLATARAVIVRNLGFPAEAIARAPRLEVIAAHGTGTDRIDHAAAAARGIAVVSTPGTNAASVAEHAAALMLACARHLAAADRALRGGDWQIRDRLTPMELGGRRIGLVGFGHVARAFAHIARCLGMEVRALSAHAPADIAAPDLATLLGGADVVSLHGVPGRAPRLGAAEIAAMRPGAILINTARGGLVDEAALAEALHTGHLRAAALDVFAAEPLPADSPLLDAPNLILTPHMGGSSDAARDRTSRAVALRVLEALRLPVPA